MIGPYLPELQALITKLFYLQTNASSKLLRQKCKNLINKEYKIITYSGTNRLYSTPSASLINDCVLRLSDISNNGKRQKKFSGIHAKALQGIKKKYQTAIKISNWKHFGTLIENFTTIDCKLPVTSTTII